MNYKKRLLGGLILFLSLLSLSMTASAQITLNVKGKPLREVVKQIESTSEYRFFYNDDINGLGRLVTLNVKNASITTVMNQISAQTSVSYLLKGKYQIVLSNAKSAAAKTSVKGIVVDEKGEPVIGASIRLKGTSGGTITNSDGEFTLNDVSLDNILEISYIGYTTKEVKVKGGNMRISLREDSKSLNEVVVVGYGVQRKKLVTGSTIQVGADNLSSQHTVNAFGALQSQAPGVQITQTSGEPGEGYKVNIRGIGTNGTSTPLYVIDGVAGGNLNDLDPNDIESIDILKDAASAAIYGSRAANGVILVTTKKGKEGKLHIDYNGYFGIQKPVLNGVKTLNAKQYMEIINKALEAAGTQTYDFASLIPKQYQQIQSGEWNGTDWLNASIKNNAPVTNHAVNITGGNDLSRFSLGLTYLNQDGTIGKPALPGFERYTLRINSDYTLYKNNGRDILKLGENVMYVTNTKHGINIGNNYNNNIRDLLTACPLIPEYNSDGDLYTYKDMVADNWDFDQSMVNPLAKINDTHGGEKTENHKLQINAYLEFAPIRNLTLKSSYGYLYNQSAYRHYVPTYHWSSDTSNETDDITQRQSYSHNWTWENTANYILKTDKHSFDLLLGQSLEKWGYGNSVSAKNSNSLFPNSFKNAYIDNTQGINTTDTEISGAPNTVGSLASFFGRLNYNYNETYMASLIMRADGSSNFARGHRWGYFPSVSAGWVITNEKFMAKTSSWLDFLKIRGSWGQNGNADIDNFQYLATIAFDYDSQYFYNDKNNPSTGAYPDILPNKDVSWETSEQLDFGFDARLLSNRLGITFDWYNKKTKDWLVVATQLLSYGTGAPYINGGDVENKGFELAFNWNDKIGDFSYGANVSIAKNKNKVTRLANEEGIIHGPEDVLAQNTAELYRVQVGYPMGYFWGYKTAGVFQTQDEIDKFVAAGGKTLQTKPQPGDYKFVDTNGDGTIDSNDKTMIGDPNPDYTLGLGLNCSYRGFDFAVSAHGAFGQQIAKCYRMFSDKPNQNYTTDVYDIYWTGEGTTNCYPRFTDGKNTNMKEVSDLYIEDGDYLKISNITIGYDFKKLFANMPLQKCRIFVTAQNLITFTSYSGMDPEIGYGDGKSWASGIDIGYYPNPKSFLFGVNLEF